MQALFSCLFRVHRASEFAVNFDMLYGDALRPARKDFFPKGSGRPVLAGIVCRQWLRPIGLQLADNVNREFV